MLKVFSSLLADRSCTANKKKPEWCGVRISQQGPIQADRAGVRKKKAAARKGEIEKDGMRHIPSRRRRECRRA
jgi:hypothetical protein